MAVTNTRRVVERVIAVQVGDRARIRLKEITDNIDRSIDGRIGTLESNNLDPYVPFDFCIRIGRMLFGINADELEEVGENDHT